ncbi:MAG: SRPBCC family protein [Solirubrobacteraceae bacterium]
MSSESRHISIGIDRSAAAVYDYVSDPSHLPEWATGVSGSIEQVDGQWIAQSPMGPVVVVFAERNEYGVLDHDVTLPDGKSVHNPMRVIPDDGDCEVIFTLRRNPEMTSDDFKRDAETVAADLQALKKRLEGILA